MRLVIDSRGSAVAGLKRYNGEGIFSSIGRKLFLSGLRKVINAVEEKNHSQKIVDVVVNGRRDSSKKKVVGISQAGVKRKSSTTQSQSLKKARRYSNSTTDKLINSSGGSGIILD